MAPDFLRLLDVAVKFEMSLWADAENATVAACGIKLGSVMALRAVARRDDMARVQDLALDLDITIGAVSKIVDRLESAGLARRQPHETDGRSHLIGRTRKGVATTDTAVAVMSKALEQRIAPVWSPTKIASVIKTLEAVADRASEQH